MEAEEAARLKRLRNARARERRKLERRIDGGTDLLVRG
jgi:hypothetical protein